MSMCQSDQPQEMLLQQGRVWGNTIEDALHIIHELHGEGTISIREFRKRADGGIWYEYTIDLPLTREI